MDDLLASLKDVVNTLHRASGLSVTLARAAEMLDQATRLEQLWSLVKSVQPESQDHGLKLFQIGVQLYNIVRKGSSSDVHLLRLRLLASYALVGTGGSAAGDSLADAKKLDAMRCLSKTGLLLVQVGETSIGREALVQAIELLGKNPVDTIIRVFGTSQETHDCGFAFFAALTGLLSVAIESSIRKEEASGENLIKVVALLRNHSEFLLMCQTTNHLTLRSIIDKGVQMLSKDEGLPLQRWLYDEWVNFSTCSVNDERAISCRLAFTLARLKDTLGAITVLETALRTESPCLNADRRDLLTAKCAVAIAKLQDETVMFDRVRSHSTQGDAESLKHASERFASAQRECLRSFADLANIWTELKDENDSSSSIMVKFLLELLHDCHRLLDSFSDTYEVLLRAPSLPKSIALEIIKYGLMHAFPKMVSWFESHDASGIKIFAKEMGADTSLAATLWTQLNKHRKQSDWSSVRQLASIISELVSDEGRFAQKARFAILTARLRLELPVKNGDVDEERRILREIKEGAQRFRSVSISDQGLRYAAALLEAKCILRLGILSGDPDPCKVTAELRNLAESKTMRVESLMCLVTDANDLASPKISEALIRIYVDLICNDVDAKEEDIITCLRNFLYRITSLHLASPHPSKLMDDVTSVLQHRLGQVIMNDSLRKFIKSAIITWLQFQPNECCSIADAVIHARLLAICGSVCPDVDERDAFLVNAVGVLTKVTSTVILSTTRELRSKQLEQITITGESLCASLDCLSEKRRREDEKIGISAILGTMFSAIGGSKPSYAEGDLIATGFEDDILERVKDILDDGEFAFPTMRGLEVASIVAHRLKLIKTSRELLIRVIQYEIASERPNYGRIVGECFTRLLLRSHAVRDVIEWAQQIDNIRKASALDPVVLERAAIVLWSKRTSDGPFLQDVARRAFDWLGAACSQSREISEKRATDLKAIRSVLLLEDSRNDLDGFNTVIDHQENQCASSSPISSPPLRQESVTTFVKSDDASTEPEDEPIH